MRHCCGVTNWFRSIVGRNQDGKSGSVSRTEQLPQLQLQLLNTPDGTSALQLPNARSESSSSSSSSSVLVPASMEKSCGFSVQSKCVNYSNKWNHMNKYKQTETDSHRPTQQIVPMFMSDWFHLSSLATFLSSRSSLKSVFFYFQTVEKRK